MWSYNASAVRGGNFIQPVKKASGGRLVKPSTAPCFSLNLDDPRNSAGT